MPEKFIDYNGGYSPFDVWALRDGDKVWRIVSASVEPDIMNASRYGDCCFSVEYMFVASLGMDKKFKVYYDDARKSKEQVAHYGYKLPIKNASIARQLFYELIENGWEFIVEY